MNESHNRWWTPVRAALLVALALAGPLASAAGDPAAGKKHYPVCAACHGQSAEGNKALNAPRLAGQEAWYIERQLENFQKGIRGSHAQDTYGQQMAPMAKMLADGQAIADVAAYISSLDAPPPEQTVEGDAARGKKLYASCATCHGKKAEGNKALNAPKLVGLDDWYLVRQLEHYKKGIRGAHPEDTYGQQMAPMAQTLPDGQAIKDVVAYINSLQ